MAFCNNCGKWVKEGAHFCLHCGMDQMPGQVGWEVTAPPHTRQPQPEAPLQQFFQDALAADPAPGQDTPADPAPQPRATLRTRMHGLLRKSRASSPAARQPRVIPTPGLGAYLVPLLLMLLPLVGLVIAFIWAFTDERNLFRRDLARSVLIIYLILALLLALLLVTLGPRIRAQLYEPFYNIPESEAAPYDGSFEDFFKQFQEAPRGASRA